MARKHHAGEGFFQVSIRSVEACRIFDKPVDRCNLVFRDVRDRNGSRLGTLVERHDSTEAGIIAAAQRATVRMYADYPEASNIQSRMGATDAAGNPKWSISPNFMHLAEIGTDEASYIWGNVTGCSIERSSSML
jgi:hypothetical protein